MSQRTLLQRMRTAVVDLILRLPEPIAVKLLPRSVRFDPDSVPRATAAPSAPVRLYVAPVNYAAQGYAWARAAERLPGVAAVNMQYRGDRDYGFPADVAIDQRVFTMSRRWGVRQLAAVGTGFTHVMFEAEKPIFGRACGFDVETEIVRLRQAGVRVAMASHGSDLRLPSRHRAIDEWSPFEDAADPWVRALEEQAMRNRHLLKRLEASVFVSTPDLLLDWPAAAWLPVVVSPEKWQLQQSPFPTTGPVRVTHAPTNRRIKGTELIEGELARLVAEGTVAYKTIEAVPAAQMPAVYAATDVVIEQFRIGTYSSVAIEAMAAGRLVIAHVHDQVRQAVRELAGVELPIVEATPTTLRDVLNDVAERRDHYQDVAQNGLEFVRAVHDGRFSASALAPFLGVPTLLPEPEPRAR